MSNCAFFWCLCYEAGGGSLDVYSTSICWIYSSHWHLTYYLPTVLINTRVHPGLPDRMFCSFRLEIHPACSANSFCCWAAVVYHMAGKYYAEILRVSMSGHHPMPASTEQRVILLLWFFSYQSALKVRECTENALHSVTFSPSDPSATLSSSLPLPSPCIGVVIRGSLAQCDFPIGRRARFASRKVPRRGAALLRALPVPPGWARDLMPSLVKIADIKQQC
ncbi:hypothetical protein V8C44DRAFT_14632 [Trichoderma aethiopicum]